MSKDESESIPMTGTSPESPPEPEGPAPPSRDATLRGQVIEVINDVLADPDAERGWAKRQMRELLALYPDEPERALLAHLIITRQRTAAIENEDRPVH